MVNVEYLHFLLVGQKKQSDHFALHEIVISIFHIFF